MSRNIDQIAAEIGMTTAEIADVLDRAADEMMFRGAAKGRLINDKGEVCLLAAIGLALGMDEVEVVTQRETGISQSEAVQLLRAYMVHKGINIEETVRGKRLVWYRGVPIHITSKNFMPAPQNYNDNCNTQPGEAESLLRHAAKWLRETDGNGSLE